MKIRTIILHFTFTLVIIWVAVLNVAPAYADEITPDPSSYSYGSTSELSPTSSITQATDSGNLVNSGDPVSILIIVAMILIGTGIIVIIYIISRSRTRKPLKQVF